MSEIDPAVVVLVSAFLPLVFAVINRHNWTKEAKALIVFTLTVVIGIAIGYAMGVRSFEGFATVCASIYGLSQAAFFGVYRPTQVADAIEKRTG
jgi:ABC-type nitrate/sulfonate/bicarbonate transport system permease component